MNKVKVITDTCADLGKELRAKYGIDYVQMRVIWAGEDKPASNDWDIYSVKEFYDAVRAGIRITTSQVPDEEFERKFTLYLEQGYDIVYVACSTALSGSYARGQIVAGELMKKYEGHKIICVDAKASCMGEGIIAIEAAKLAALGAGVEEVAAHAQAVAPKSMQFCTVGDLVYFKRAGRVKASTAFFGNLFGIKPILINNKNGLHEAIRKVKGRKNSLDELVNMLAGSLTDEQYPASEQTIYVAHADGEADAQYLAEQVKAKINPKEVYICEIGPTVGATTGPETVALYAFGDQYATIDK